MKQKQTWIPYEKSLPYIEGRYPFLKPDSYIVKEEEDSYRIVEGRRPSNMLLVNLLRKEVDLWRERDYPGITPTTRELLYFWFYNDHRINQERFHYWFCQREAVETLIYLYEVKKYKDLEEVLLAYIDKSQEIKIVKDQEKKRQLLRKSSDFRYIKQDLPEKNLLRYAFKMATGSGKTIAMSLIIVWSYFNRIREKQERYPNNFLIIAPNIIVYERLAKDFANNKIFYNFPLIPPSWKSDWNIKITLREDTSPLNPSGNIIVNNIQQLYQNQSQEKTMENIVNEILGRKPKKDLTSSFETLSDKIKKLENLMVINDEAHHVHDEILAWHKTLITIHKALPRGIHLWLDFSATPKTQTGSYYPWIIVDYPLAQAIEDQIVKAPLIVQRIDQEDPVDITRDNVVQKYGDWIIAGLERWKEHYQVYSQVAKKPVLFIMTEKNEYADKIAEFIRKRKDLGLENPEEEVVVIHVKTRETEGSDTEIKITEKDLPKLRELVRKIDEPENKVKIIVSNLMLREGWDVQNVTIILGLRPFTSQAEILPEQAVGRGLRLIRGISHDYVQTLEVMGTKAFENFVRELEKEGVGINVVKNPPPLPIVIYPEKSKEHYDIEIPLTEYRYKKNYKKIEELDPYKIPSLYSSEKLEKERKILLRMEFPLTETEIHQTEIEPMLTMGRELVSSITKEVIRRSRINSGFNILYPKVKEYILNQCFGISLYDIEDVALRKILSEVYIQESIIEAFIKEISKLSIEEKESIIALGIFKLSSVSPFTWRRKHLMCNKTIFNFVAVYNDFEANFAKFLDDCFDIERFSALADKFSVDYLSSRGTIRFYYPDFIAVQNQNDEKIFWFIETKGREFEDTDRKDAAIQNWCRNISEQTLQKWEYIKIYQKDFELYKKNCQSFQDLINFIK